MVMRRVLTLPSHQAFHIAVARTVLASGAMALLFAVWAGVFPAAWPLLRGLLTVLVLGASIAPPKSLRHGALLLIWGMLGGAASALALGSPVLAALSVSVCVGAATALGGLPRGKSWLTGLSGAALAFAASFVPDALLGQDWFVSLPGQLGSLLAGMGAGLMVSSTAFVRQSQLQLETEVGEPPALPAGASPKALVVASSEPAESDEIATLVAEAQTTFKETVEALRPHPLALQAAEELVQKIARFGAKFREIADQAKKADRRRLEQRRDDLAQRKDATSDEKAKTEYARAEAALAEQINYLNEIDKERERAIARLHHQVATLERLRLASLRHRSVDAGKMGEDLKGIVDDLTQAGQEMDHAAEALAEVN